jgi:hypothetical protein
MSKWNLIIIIILYPSAQFLDHMSQYFYVFPVVYHHLIILLLLSGSLPEFVLLPFAPAQPYSSTPVSEKVCKYSNRSAL